MQNSALGKIKFGNSFILILGLVQLGISFQTEQVIMAIVAGVTLFLSAFSLINVRKLTSIVQLAIAFCQKIEKGDFETRITDIEGDGETSKLLWAMNAMVDRMDAFVREAMASMEEVSHNKFYRHIIETGMVGTFLHAAKTINNATDAMGDVSIRLNHMADELQATVGTGVQAIFDNADQIIDRTTKMGNRINTSSTRSVDVAKAAQRTNETVRVVAEATNQLSASISEISAQVSLSTKISRDAVENAQSATHAVEGLTAAASKIGEVVGLITAIAEQTNLLALNATIEAARAGEAGKGFAVVAGEVKNLANQTARATDEIAKQVDGIQKATFEASEAIKQTGQTIEKIDEISTVIASAVEEQGASTENIAQNMKEVAENSETVRSRIVHVNQGSATSYSAAIRVMWAARDLHEPTKRLDREVKEFLDNIRTKS